MQRAGSIFMLFMMGIVLFPWQMICLEHPLGHDHHEQDGPSPCEIRKQYDGDGPVFWPPMPCDHLSPQKGHFQQAQKMQVKPPLPTLAVVAFLFYLVSWDLPKNQFYPQPDPQNNSDPPRDINTLRGPPLILSLS